MRQVLTPSHRVNKVSKPEQTQAEVSGARAEPEVSKGGAGHVMPKVVIEKHYRQEIGGSGI